jgi:hypothetical protein
MMLNHAKRKATMMIKSLLRYEFSQKGQKRHFFKILDEETPKTAIVHPKQYPANLVDASPLIKRGRPVRFLSPRD